MLHAVKRKTFHELLLPVLLIQVDDDRPGGFFRLPLAASDEALLQREEAVHFIPHQQHAAITRPLLYHLRPGHRRPARHNNKHLCEDQASADQARIYLSFV